MSPQRYEQRWIEPTLTRECGSCYACCVYLGIEELKKWTGQTCRHLHGAADPTKRCTIYANRPHACSGYQCAWRAGFGPAELQPSVSGMLITIYQSETTPGDTAATVIITNVALAMALNPITVATELIMLGLANQVRLVDFKAKTVLLFTDGKIFKCKILPPDSFESLIFAADTTPIGKFHLERNVEK